MPSFDRGAYPTGNRTMHKLVASGYELSTCPEHMVTDPDLPVKFSFPFIGTAYKQAKIVIPKGRVVSIRADKKFMRDPLDGTMRPCLTIANGGTNTSDTKDYGGTYTRTANVPIGVTISNVPQTVPGTFDFGYPSVADVAHIEVPYFVGNRTEAAAFEWYCAYNSNDTTRVFSIGDPIMSDANGKFIKWITGDAAAQVIGKVVNIDRNIPIDLFEFIMLDVASSLAGFTKEYKSPTDLAYNPYNVLQPIPNNVMNEGDTTYGTRSGDSTGYVKPYGYDPQGYDMLASPMPNIMDFSTVNKLFGIPELTDGVANMEAEVTESFDPTDTSNYSYNSTTDITTIILTKTMIKRDSQGALNPSSSHPFPSVLAVYDDSAPTVRLEENKDYVVDRQRGKVFIYDTAGTETYNFTYTHLEDVEYALPTSWNYAGVVGGLRMIVNCR